MRSSVSCYCVSYQIFGKWQDEEAFFKYYAAAHKKLSELGFDRPTWASRLVKAMTNRPTMANAVVGVLVVAGIAFLHRQAGRKKGSALSTNPE